MVRQPRGGGRGEKQKAEAGRREPGDEERAPSTPVGLRPRAWPMEQRRTPAPPRRTAAVTESCASTVTDSGIAVRSAAALPSDAALQWISTTSSHRPTARRPVNSGEAAVAECPEAREHQHRQHPAGRGGRFERAAVEQVEAEQPGVEDGERGEGQVAGGAHGGRRRGRQASWRSVGRRGQLIIRLRPRRMRAGDPATCWCRSEFEHDPYQPRNWPDFGPVCDTPAVPRRFYIRRR